MGDGGRFPLETWFWEMPICTRWWTTATVLTSGLVQCNLVTPFQLFYSFRTVFNKSQVRRDCEQTLSVNLICLSTKTNDRRLCSTGGFSRRSSTSGPFLSIFSSMSTSYSATRASSRSPQAGHQPTSRGCCSTPWRA